jgi:hypothetical protein
MHDVFIKLIGVEHLLTSNTKPARATIASFILLHRTTSRREIYDFSALD